MNWPKIWIMRAVSNTSPLSNLAFIQRLELLKSQADELWIPTAVEEELQAHPDPMARAAIEAAIQEQWIRVDRQRRTVPLFWPYEWRPTVVHCVDDPPRQGTCHYQRVR